MRQCIRQAMARWTKVVGAGSLFALGACAGARDPGAYAEAALREDAREAALATPDADEPARIDTAAVAAALGSHGQLRGGVYAVRLPGGASQLAFHPAGSGRAALTGDVVVPRRSVSAAVGALAAHGIAVTAVRAVRAAESSAAAGDMARAVLQVWAVEDAAALARALSASLNQAQATIDISAR